MDDDLRTDLRRPGDEPAVQAPGMPGPPGRTGARPWGCRTGRSTAWRMVGVVAAAGMLAGCTGGSEAPAASGTPTTSATATPTATPTPTPATPEPTATTAPVPTEPAAPAPTTDPAAPPPVSTPVHGATVWGVYLAMMTSEDDPAWVQSGIRLEQLGYEPGYGDVSCDQGATETLGLPENVLVRWVHFDTREDAERFVGLYGPDTLGLAQVTTLCLD